MNDYDLAHLGDGDDDDLLDWELWDDYLDDLNGGYAMYDDYGIRIY